MPFVIFASLIPLICLMGVMGRDNVGLIVCIGLEGVGPLERGRLARKPVLALNFWMLD